MYQRFHSATIQHAWETLHDPFSDQQKHKLPLTIYRDGERSYSGFDSYTLTGAQAGCISTLLWKACQLDKQVALQKRLIKRLHGRLRETQKIIDRSITHLDDPDR
jgi:hypothetical protein